MRDRLEDLEFADHICLLPQRLTDMKEKLKRLQGEAELAGLNINVKKTNEMRINVTTGCSTDEETGLAAQIRLNVSPPLPSPSPLAKVQSFADSLTSVSVHAHIYKNTVKR
jgi:DNA uptake protein ComE-like DNA-binding protein